MIVQFHENMLFTLTLLKLLMVNSIVCLIFMTLCFTFQDLFLHKTNGLSTNINSIIYKKGILKGRCIDK